MMKPQQFKYIYGPVYSWRVGMSLGVDPVASETKMCNFDCVYCQLGRSRQRSMERRVYVPTDAVVQEILASPPVHLDHISFSGCGEPTLALNLGEMIAKTKAHRKDKIAVITNSSLLHRPDVRADLRLADFVLAKLDASCEESFALTGQAGGGVQFFQIVEGIQALRQEHRGKIALQIMFYDANLRFAPDIAQLAKNLGADEVQLNTPLRPSGVKALSMGEMEEVERYFKGLPVVNVYKAPHEPSPSWDREATVRRHGNYL